MFVRQITRQDLPEVFTITSEGFVKDKQYRWMHPRQDQYPEDLARTQHIRLRTRIVSPSQVCFVAVTEESDPDWSGKPEIAGYAFFVRSGDDEEGKKFKQMTDSLSKKIERYLLSWELFYETTVLNRVTDFAREKEYMKSTFCDFYETLGPRWHLAIIAVSVNHQRRGVGNMLVKQGQKLAAEENVPMTLEASVPGRGLYSKCGFKIVKEGEIAKGLEGVSMVWEPESSKGKWLEDVGDGRAKVKAIL